MALVTSKSENIRTLQASAIESFQSLDTIENLQQFVDVYTEDSGDSLLQRNCLFFAVQYEKVWVLEYLLGELGWNPNVKDESSNSCLHLAAAKGHFKSAELLVKMKADINSANFFGDTPFHVAVASDLKETPGIIDLFLRSGGKYTMENHYHIPVIEASFLVINNYRRIADFLWEESQSSMSREEDSYVLKDASFGLEFHPIPVIDQTSGPKNCPEKFYYTKCVLSSFSLADGVGIEGEGSCDCTDGCLSDCPCSNKGSIKYMGKNSLKLGHFSEGFEVTVCECQETCKCVGCNNFTVGYFETRDLTTRVEIKYISPSLGFGVNASEDISVGTLVGIYTGQLIEEKSLEFVEDDRFLFDIPSVCEGAVKRAFYVDAKTYGNFTRFINHSCDPNLAVVPVNCNRTVDYAKLCFFAIKNIKQGSQLTFDYGKTFWSAKLKELNCCCGSMFCRYSH